MLCSTIAAQLSAECKCQWARASQSATASGCAGLVVLGPGRVLFAALETTLAASSRVRWQVQAGEQLQVQVPA
eukprot:908381-Rhodomonas_salina.1